MTDNQVPPLADFNPYAADPALREAVAREGARSAHDLLHERGAEIGIARMQALAEAANLALKGLTRGGVYVGGGIAPAVLRDRWRDLFVAAFVAKGTTIRRSGGAATDLPKASRRMPSASTARLSTVPTRSRPQNRRRERSGSPVASQR